MPDHKANYLNKWDDFLADYQLDNSMTEEFDDVAGDFGNLLDWDDEVDGSNSDGFEWDEPEPLVEFDGELQRPIYVMDDNDDDELVIELRISQWISAIYAASAIDRYLILELLKGLGRNRIRRWLPWLNKQQWTGESLLLFLRFRMRWESSPHWWECSYWDWRVRCWYPTRHRYSLTLDETYELVHRRLDCSPNEVIDETWLGDWLELALWRHGFRSFASFAVFRAGFAGGGNWQQHIEWYATDDLGSNETGPQWNNGYRLYRYGPPIWFAEQNWFDPGEWHDNLGW